MEDTRKNTGGKNVLGAALVGMALGAVAGVLLAPKSGKETRKELADLAERMKGDISERVKKLGVVSKSAYKEIVDVVVRRYEETKEITGEQAKKLRDELSAGYDRVKANIAEGKDDVVQEIEEVKDDAAKKTGARK